MSQENDQLTNHEYDGIKEYDNPLPSWWLWTFFLTIIFSFIYYLHYEVAGGQNLDAELKQAIQKIESLQASHQGAQKVMSESDLMKLFQENKDEALGVATYDSKCAACHGPKMEGLIGPNLTDRFWIHGQGKAMDILQVIQKGVSDKGMPPWEGLLKEDELIAVSAYIYSKRGTQEKQGKEPQGQEVKEYY